jgi:hypothetical protein
LDEVVKVECSLAGVVSALEEGVFPLGLSHEKGGSPGGTDFFSLLV